MASEAFLGLKTSLGSFHFSLGMVTEFASRPHAWRLVSIDIGSFRYTLGIRQRSGAWKPVNILLLWILLWATAVKNVWSLHSHSACSQVSVLLFYAWTMKFMWVQICVGDMHVSHLHFKNLLLSYSCLKLGQLVLTQFLWASYLLGGCRKLLARAIKTVFVLSVSLKTTFTSFRAESELTDVCYKIWA